MLSKIRQFLGKRFFFLSRIGYYQAPRLPLANFPDGMSVTRLADTGVTVVDNFCTRDEAEYFIRSRGGEISRSTIVENEKELKFHAGRTSSDAFIRLTNNEENFQNLVFRAASLFGLPVSYCERVSITRYGEGEYYKSHLDYDNSFHADRMYTCLIYLNDLGSDQGGGTWFSRLNLLASPKLGRAVCWVNTDPDGTRHPETLHAALPPKGEGAEKWVIQLWFRGYPWSKRTPTPVARPAPVGKPLSAADELPAGVSLGDDIDEATVYGDSSV